jgi:hypothetical protein
VRKILSQNLPKVATQTMFGTAFCQTSANGPCTSSKYI